MDADEINELHCRSCCKKTTDPDGQLVCKVTGFPVAEESPGCISHSYFDDGYGDEF